MKSNIIPQEKIPMILSFYTKEGVAEIEEVSVIIETMVENLSSNDLKKFLVFIGSGNLNIAYDMFRYIQENKA
ncbi:hypothetical protein PAECIP111891_06695 [Paenibacillus allorhizoplanae]|uniref:Uncharacterized protein n=1 Tax=Paenibacillus allorhizoplanae TaxID=2905648 RepID=A0ABN8HA57_9BACL|nr:hypothetical protein [Paenibacillus allorhizoplanae]CAH1230604.1 hypothetical protein PAECIP111891_06695 [Paenibacillus allorhizoplanae]